MNDHPNDTTMAAAVAAIDNLTGELNQLKAALEACLAASRGPETPAGAATPALSPPSVAVSATAPAGPTPNKKGTTG